MVSPPKHETLHYITVQVNNSKPQPQHCTTASNAAKAVCDIRAIVSSLISQSAKPLLHVRALFEQDFSLPAFSVRSRGEYHARTLY